MKKKDGAEPERGRPGFWLIMAITTPAAVCLAFLWYFSPLGLWFPAWLDDVERRRFVWRVYELSRHWGIPALLVAQASALILACCGRRLAAEVIAVLANLSFAGMMVVMIGQLG